MTRRLTGLSRFLTRPFFITALLGSFLMTACLVTPARAGVVTVAVAANFLKPLQGMQAPFERTSGHTLIISGGSTGQLYAQITNGAPYDVLLSADEARPRLLEETGGGVAGTRFTYAVGRMTLWSAVPGLIGPDGAAFLRAGGFRSLAIANPALAPYGLAAKQTLEQLGLWERLSGRIVLGENIGQTFAMAHTGNADAGFVALSQVLDAPGPSGSRWDVPAHMHDPIVQQAILLEPGRDNPAALAFMRFLRGDAARRIITGAGYGLE